VPACRRVYCIAVAIDVCPIAALTSTGHCRRSSTSSLDSTLRFAGVSPRAYRDGRRVRKPPATSAGGSCALHDDGHHVRAMARRPDRCVRRHEATACCTSTCCASLRRSLARRAAAGRDWQGCFTSTHGIPCALAQLRRDAARDREGGGAREGQGTEAASDATAPTAAALDGDGDSHAC
jgi:hypothetical protein